jgi:hypothetical protein
MKNGLGLWVLAAMLVFAAGCSKEEAGTASPGSPAGTGAAATAGKQEEGRAEAGVVPGSYQDWCVEHGVPETACTRCDPSLIPAFKAVGDWDDEHGLPKSQCLKCDPKLTIVRPPRAEDR